MADTFDCSQCGQDTDDDEPMDFGPYKGRVICTEGHGMDLVELATQIERREQILATGIGLSNLDEYNVLTLNLAESARGMLRAITDVMELRNELNREDGTACAVFRAFAAEIDRALKGQRG